MVAALSVRGKSEVDANMGGVGGDLLLSLALGTARAEGLTDLERASIAVETPLTRALRWATSVDGVRCLALVGPSGSGKTFAARMADRHGMLSLELPSADAATADDVARGVMTALRENRRFLLTARPDDLLTWATCDDLDEAVAALLREMREAAGARDEWPLPSARSIEVLDLSYVVAARSDVVDDLLRRAASLALGSPRDTAREAAAVALRDRKVRAWATACVSDAERRLGPLTISGLWRFVATLACGARSVRDRGRFDLADSVAARLLRHEFASESLRAFASRQNPLAGATLASLSGFDGAADDIYCADPQVLVGQSAVFLVEPPPLDSPQDDYQGLIKRAMAGDRLSVHTVLSQALADVLAALTTTGVERAPPSERATESMEANAPSIHVSAAVPNLFTRRALDDAWVAALCVRCRGQSLILGPRAYNNLRDLAAQGDFDAVARHAEVAAWCRAIATASDQHPSTNPDAPPFEAALSTSRDRDIDARRAIVVSKDLSLTTRPLGLLLALTASGSLDDVVTDGGALRVSSPADLAAMTPALSSLPEHVGLWQPGDRTALGASLRDFVDAREGVINAFARARSPSSGSRVLDACLSLELLPATDAQARSVIERYLSAYTVMMDAAIIAGGEVLDRALMLDVAYCGSEAQRRARLMPMHPLMLLRRALPDGEGDEALPPVIAARHRRTLALYAEGEPGFYHSEPERWPTIAAQRSAIRDAARAWLLRAGEVVSVDVDLIDALFVAPLVEEVALCVAQHTRERRATPGVVRARALASSLARAASFAPIALDGVEGVPVVCDPSVRSASEFRTDVLVFAVIPASHGGRRSGVESESLPSALACYTRALVEARIDPRPHKLEPSPEPTASNVAFISWKAAPIEDVRAGGRWRLSLPGGLAPASSVMSASSGVTSTPPAQEVPVVVDTSGNIGTTPAEVTPSSEDHRDPEQSESKGDAPLDGSDVVTSSEGRRWTRQDLRAQVARVFGRVAYTSDEALIADLIRDAVAGRRGPLRHVIARDVAECVGPLLERGEPHDVVTTTIDVLVDMGDLVARRSSKRGPYLLELASAAFVDLRSSERVILLGRAESALSERTRAWVTPAGMLRSIDLARAREARDELGFRGAAEIAWEDWARVPPFRSPDESLGAQSELSRFEGDLDPYDAFDPTTPPRYYRGRFRRGELERILTRDRWAVAARDAGFDAREYRLFRRADGVVTSTAVERSRFIELAAACAARAAEGRRFTAAEGSGEVRLYFPPPRWLARALALGQAVDPGDALIASRVPDELREDVRGALQDRLWCEVVSI